MTFELEKFFDSKCMQINLNQPSRINSEGFLKEGKNAVFLRRRYVKVNRVSFVGQKNTFLALEMSLSIFKLC